MLYLKSMPAKRGPKASIIARLTPEARSDAERKMAELTAEFLPELERHANESFRKDAELVAAFVASQLEVVARACHPVCNSPEEFEMELWGGIGQFVKLAVDKIPGLSEAMREELDGGFTFFVLRMNPWEAMLREDKTNWYTGGCTGQALTRAALRLSTGD